MLEHTCQDNEHRPEDSIFTRRQFLNRLGMGFGGLSLTGLVGMGLLAPPNARADAASPFAPKAPQFAPRAKRVSVAHLRLRRPLAHIDTWITPQARNWRSMMSRLSRLPGDPNATVLPRHSSSRRWGSQASR